MNLYALLFRSKTKIGDIALLQLEPNDKMQSRLADHPAVPIEMAPKDFDPTGLKCVVSGWGHEKSRGGSVPDILRKTSVQVVSQQGCFKMYSPTYPWDNETDSMLCAGGRDRDACQVI